MDAGSGNVVGFAGTNSNLFQNPTARTFLVREYWLPKNGNTLEEYEDAFASVTTDGRFAIADGATESSFAASWASALARGFVSGPPELSAQPESQFREWLIPLQQAWHASVPWGNLSWFAEDKARAGAFSSLLGLAFVDNRRSEASTPRAQRAIAPSVEASDTITAESQSQSASDGSDSGASLSWHALAVGDSCLFQVRNCGLLKSFPLDRSEQFGNHPLLVSSNPVKNQQVWSELSYEEGGVEPGDIFLLATDALAHWFLREGEKGEQPWNILTILETDLAFASFVGDLREKGSIRNDDTTLLLVRVPNAVPS
jgi:hypothetical protein